VFTIKYWSRYVPDNRLGFYDRKLTRLVLLQARLKYTIVKHWPVYEKEVCFISQHTYVRGHKVLKILTNSVSAAIHICNIVVEECVFHALQKQLCAGGLIVQKSPIIPVTALPTLIGDAGSNLASIRSRVSKSLYLFPVGDTVGSHAFFVECGTTISE
jgi:hypothetical protein